MIDIVTKLNNFCDERAWKFVHGTAVSLNLTDLEVTQDDVILFLLSPIKTQAVIDDEGNKEKFITTVKMFLLRSADISDTIANETGFERKGGRYVQNVARLNPELVKLLELFEGCGCKMNSFNVSDTYGEYDFYFDGYIIDMIYECY